MKFPFIEKFKNRIGLHFNSPLRKGPKRDFVFIHINKTAGTSIVSYTGKPFRKHLTAKEVIDVIGNEKWNSAYKFTVVRNPWDKMFSHYKHNIKTKPKTMMKNGGVEFVSFSEWLKFTLGPDKDKKFYNRPQHFLPQVEWLKDYNGQIKMDKIIHFENLAHEYKSVADDLGFPETLPHLNSTLASTYREFYDDFSAKLVADWFQEDLKEFGYSFDSQS